MKRLLWVVIGIVCLQASAHATLGYTTDLAVWLKADTGVETNASGVVTNWVDQATANGSQNATIGTGAPAVHASAVNGLPAIYLDGDDVLSYAGQLNGGNMSDVTIFAVWESLGYSGGVEGLFAVGDVSSGTANQIFGVDVALQNKGIIRWNYGFTQFDKGYPQFEYGITEYQIETNDTQSTVAYWVNGEAGPFLSATAPNATIELADNGYVLGSLVSGGSYANFSRGHIAEILIYTGTLTDPQRDQVYDYLRGRYNLYPTELLVWLKADAGVTTNGSGVVTAWADQAVDNGSQDASLGTGDPELQDVDGADAIYFDGDDALKFTGQINSGRMSNVTVVAVSKRTGSADAVQGIFTVGDVTSGGADQVFGGDVANDASSVFQYNAGSSTFDRGLELDSIGVTEWQIEQGDTHSTVSFWSSGTDSMIAASLTGSVNPGNSIQLLDGGYVLGSLVSSAGAYENFLTGYVTELLIYSGNLTDEQRSELYTYLKFKYMDAGVPYTTDLAVWLRSDADVVTNGSGVVTAWNDQATENGSQNAVAALNGPTYVTLDDGFTPAVYFDGDDSLRFTGQINGGTLDDVTVFSVFKDIGSSSGIEGLFVVGDVTTGQPDTLFGADLGVNNKSIFRYNAGFTTFNEGVPANTLGLGEWQVESNDTHSTVAYWGNGVEGFYETVVGPNNYLHLSDGGYIVGSLIGSDGVIGNFMGGYVCELLIYTGPLTADQRDLVGSYLARKHGLTTGYTYIPPLAGPATILASTWMPLSNLLELTIDIPGGESQASRYSPEARADLLSGGWTNVLHSSINDPGTLAVTNLGYSAEDGSGNRVIYVDASDAKKYFRVNGE